MRMRLLFLECRWLLAFKSLLVVVHGTEKQIFSQLENKQRKTKDAILKCYPFRGQGILTTSQVLFVQFRRSVQPVQGPCAGQDINHRKRVRHAFLPSFVRPQPVEARWRASIYGTKGNTSISTFSTAILELQLKSQRTETIHGANK